MSPKRSLGDILCLLHFLLFLLLLFFFFLSFFRQKFVRHISRCLSFWHFDLTMFEGIIELFGIFHHNASDKKKKLDVENN
jgi:hypothetical protein